MGEISFRTNFILFMLFAITANDINKITNSKFYASHLILIIHLIVFVLVYKIEKALINVIFTIAFIRVN